MRPSPTSSAKHSNSSRHDRVNEPSPGAQIWEFAALGTAWSIRTREPIRGEVRDVVRALIEDFDRAWSRFRDDSLVARLRSGDAVDLGADAVEILAIYDALGSATDGAVNPLIGGALERLGYDATYSFIARGAPGPVVDWSSCERRGGIVRVPVGSVLDIGAVGKGFLAERVAAILLDGGHASVVNASGDIVNRSGQSIRVALEHPADPTSAVGVAVVDDGQAICGSAINRRAWGDGAHHLLDARTGEPIRGIVAAWAMGPDAAICDGLATAAFLTSLDRLESFGVRIITFDRNGHVERHKWTDEVFT